VGLAVGDGIVIPAQAGIQGSADNGWVPACLENRRSKTTTKDTKSTNTGRILQRNAPKAFYSPLGSRSASLGPSSATAIPEAIAKTRKSESAKGKKNPGNTSAEWSGTLTAGRFPSFPRRRE